MRQTGFIFAVLIICVASKSNNVLDVRSGLNSIELPISIISDQDSESFDPERNLWFSTMAAGVFTYNTVSHEGSVRWGQIRNFTSRMNYKGRGMELSDLKWFNGKLMSPDDKTGIVYWLKDDKVIPWAVMADGDGSVDQPYKCEWLTVKDNYLYCCGYGKEVVDNEGSIMNENPMFINRLSFDGAVQHLNWKQRFVALREAVEIRFPGYMIHESAQWSDIHQKWFFLPRHMSKNRYDPATAYAQGANFLLSTSDCFCDIEFVTIGIANTSKGFSAFQFMPGTNDEVIVALKSREVPDMALSSYIMAFDIQGEEVMPEQPIPGNFKFEGIEFYDLQRFQMFRDSPLTSPSTHSREVFVMILITFFGFFC